MKNKILFLTVFLILGSDIYGSEKKKDVFAGGGLSIGQSRKIDSPWDYFAYTDLRRLPAKDINAQVFPFKNEKWGLNYSYQWNNPLTADIPAGPVSSIKRKWNMHSVGVGYRFTSKGIQPTISGGAAFYSEDYRTQIIFSGFRFTSPSFHYGTEGVWISPSVKIPLPLVHNIFVEPSVTVLVSPVNSFTAASLKILYNFNF